MGGGEKVKEEEKLLQVERGKIVQRALKRKKYRLFS